MLHHTGFHAGLEDMYAIDIYAYFAIRNKNNAG
jgi:hypothetical protein